jgi:anthranilate synthase/aminodeoxychorismate synthase-like glutamine amidotransferase
VLVVDHKDSFVFILAEQFAKLGAQIRIYRNDLTLDALQAHIAGFAPDLVLLSPGPGAPEQTGVTLEWLRSQPRVPVLGVCLGHQAMAVAAGGAVARGPRPVHGQACRVDLVDDPLFDGMPRSLQAARYHSLVVTRVPPTLEVLGSTVEGERELVMALRHRTLPWIGLQFHPESVLSPLGGLLVERILREARAHRANSRSLLCRPS